MNGKPGFVRKTASFRIWVDEAGVGQIRILKRINFTNLVAIFEELHGEIKVCKCKRIPGILPVMHGY